MSEKKQKNSNGNGTIRRRSSGSWEGRITLSCAGGVQTRKSVYGKTKKEVQSKMDELRRQKSIGIQLSKDFTVREWSDIWYKGKKGTVAETTYYGYQYTLRLINDSIGEKKIREIKTIDIECLLKTFGETYSNSSVSKLRGMLYSLFEKAVANDLIVKNPVAYSDHITGRDEDEKEIYTTDEIRLLMIALPYDKIGITIRLMLATGLRTEELLGLEPKGIEPDGSVLHIYQAAKRIGGKMLDEPGNTKNKTSVRDVPVPKMAREYAIELRNTDSRFIWQSQRGIAKPFSQDVFRKMCMEALSKVIPYRHVTPHGLRHTYVTQLQTHGTDEMTIASLVGHAKGSMTRHYTHVLEETKKAAVEQLNDLWVHQASKIL